jgi:8-oxo-dGTP pyrophosphatase MutT (NUDIX family)
MPPEIARPRLSASVILVRDALDGLETFMVRRHVRSPVAPSAYVFPGGTVRADDVEVQVAQPLALAHRLSERADTPVAAADAAALHVCAIRELFEEAGVFAARDASGALLTIAETDRSGQERLASTRLALQARELSLARVLADWRLEPAFDVLVPFSHWVTPAALAARFDTWFFIATMPPGQAALHDTIETSAGLWLRPSAVLEGDYHTVYATAQHLRRLSPFLTVDALLAFASQKQLRRVEPTVFEAGDGLSVTLDPQLIDAW